MPGPITPALSPLARPLQRVTPLITEISGEEAACGDRRPKVSPAAAACPLVTLSKSHFFSKRAFLPGREEREKRTAILSL